MSIVRADVWQTAAGVAQNSVLQVARAVRTSTFSASTVGNNFYDVPGLSVTITPRFANSLIVLMSTLYLSTSNAYQSKWQYTRNGSTFLLGDAEGGRPRATGMVKYILCGRRSRRCTVSSKPSRRHTLGFTWQYSRTNLSNPSGGVQWSNYIS